MLPTIIYKRQNNNRKGKLYRVNRPLHPGSVKGTLGNPTHCRGKELKYGWMLNFFVLDNLQWCYGYHYGNLMLICCLVAP